MDSDLKGTTVVVVGGSSGIGWSVAELAAKAGARVFALSRSGRAPEETTGVVADATDEAAMAVALEAMAEIHHLVFTAWARQPTIPFPSLTSTHLQPAFEAKLFAALRVLRLALPRLTPSASITLTSGLVSRKYGIGSVLKGSVNAAVEATGKHLAKELAPRRVNVVSPGVTDTALWGEPHSEKRREALARAAATLPLRRVAAPEEVAGAYLFAMANPFLTGAVLDVDGGGLL